ncbi:MAG: polyphosphate kinase [Sphingopyxis sp.]
MTNDLSKYETGAKYDGDFDADIAALQARLERIQAAHITHGCASIILFEGWDAAGKGGIIQRLCGEWDPRYFQVWPIGAPTSTEQDHHYLWRFWQRMPARREIAVFDRSWYGRVAVERVEGYASEAEWQRGYDEINEFESQLVQNGTTLIKIFVHITQEEQDKRLAKRLDDPWKRWKTGAEDFRNRARRADYRAAYADMFAHTDTRWAPWHIIDGNSKKAARIAALTHIADVLEAKVPMTMPDADPAVVALAKDAFGYEAKGD